MSQELVWRKSSRSGGDGGNCVEVARVPGKTFVRDSKNREGGVLEFSSEAWQQFLGAVKCDEIA